MLLLIGIITFFAFCIWYAKRNGATGKYESQIIKISTEQDEPVDFGYKIIWLAVKTGKKEELANILELKDIESANWESGIEKAYKDGVFLTPQIGEWTLAVGYGLPAGDTLNSIEQLEKTLNKLSSKYGEAHFFGTHRIVEYHSWMKSINGKMERIYSYIGESNENLKVYGNLTGPEKELKLFDSFSLEAKSEEYWERDDLVYADEDLVMKIAEKWSINPTMLPKRNDIKEGLGLVGNSTIANTIYSK